MSSKFFLGDIVSFKNGKNVIEGQVIDLEWLDDSRIFVYTIQDKNLSEYRVGQSGVKMVPFNKRINKW